MENKTKKTLAGGLLILIAVSVVYVITHDGSTNSSPQESNLDNPEVINNEINFNQFNKSNPISVQSLWYEVDEDDPVMGTDSARAVNVTFNGESYLFSESDWENINKINCKEVLGDTWACKGE